jgi:Carboxypeptidase regulatory-like domain
MSHGEQPHMGDVQHGLGASLGRGTEFKQAKLAPMFAVLAAVGLLLAFAPSALAAEDGQITGKVTSASSNAAIAGIAVCAAESVFEAELFGHCATTNSSGEYSISGLPAGSYGVGFFSPEGSGLNYMPQFYNGKSSVFEAELLAVEAGQTVSGINAAMQVGGQITGKVTDASSKAAIAGIEVCAYNTGFFNQCAKTNPSGEYTVSGLATGSYTVYFSSPEGSGLNYIPQFYSEKSSFSEAEAVAVEAGKTKSSIDAAMVEGGQITGKVTKASGGAAIEGVQVCALEASGGGGFYGHCAQTSSTGEYTIAGLATGSYKVEFSAGETCGPSGCTQQNYLTQFYSEKSSFSEAEAVAVEAGKTKSSIDAAMVEGGQITGKVTKASGGAAIEGVQVCALEASGGGGFYGHCAQTSSTGEYTIVGLATGSYKVEFSAGETCGPSGCTQQNYLTQFYNDKSSFSEADAVAVTAGSVKTGIDAAMVVGGQITGKVTDAASKAAIAGIQVCAQQASGGGFGGSCASTNSSGEYTISGLASGEYKVEFRAGYSCGPGGCTPQNYLTQYYNGKASFAEAEAVAVEAGKVKSGIDAAMQPGGQITGTVTDASSKAAIQGIQVCAEQASGGGFEFGHCAQTSSSGEYTISGLAAGSYKVEFRAGSSCGPSGCTPQNYLTQFYNGKASLTEAEAVAVMAGSVKAGIDAAMVSGGQITGKVTDASSKAAIVGIQVCAQQASGGGLGSGCASTNSSGEYTISGLVSGSYKVEFRAGFSCTPTCTQQNYITQYYNGKSSFSEADPVTVTAGSTTPSIDAKMVEGGQITGTVTDASTKAAIAGIQVCAQPASGEGFGGCASTNGSGEYTIAGLGTGSYKVEFRAGFSCGPSGCTPQNYLTQFYNDKSSLAEADPVSVEVGKTAEGIDAQMVEGKKPQTIAFTSTKPTEATVGGPTYTVAATASSGLTVSFTIDGSSSFVCSISGTTVSFIGTGTCTIDANQAGDAKYKPAPQAQQSFTVGKVPVSTKAPELTGTPALGETLSCSQGSWENSPTSYAYKWLRDGVEIAAQTASTYVVVVADEGHGISCEVTATNTAGSTSSTSNVLTVASKPANTKVPEVTGTPVVGETLSCSTGSWSGTPVPTLSYKWLRDGVAIAGATISTYKLQAADEGHNVACEVTATNTAGEKSATSNSVSVASLPANSVLPQISGTPKVGETLSCSNGTWSGSPAPAFTYVWLRDGTAISGATASTYKVQAADEGHTLTCEVTAKNIAGSKSAPSSGVKVTVTTVAPANTEAPSVSGTPAAGQTLSCSKGSWTGTPAPTFAYKWLRDGTAIAGATESSYVVPAADEGHTLICEVTAKNSAGEKSATSAGVSVPVASPTPTNTGGGGSGNGSGGSGGGGSGAGSQSTGAGPTASGGVLGSMTHKAPSPRCKLVHVKVKHSKKTKAMRVCPKPKKHSKGKKKHGH